MKKCKTEVGANVVDNRSAGFYGIGGAFNFKSGDISGTAANTQDDKMGPGTEYGQIPTGEEEQFQQDTHFVDRSAQLRATLNSLAMMNVANVLNERKRLESVKEAEDAEDKKDKEDLDEEFLDDFDNLDSYQEDEESTN